MLPVEHPLTSEELMALLDDELPDERASLVKAHVAACEECQRVSATLSGVSSTMSRWQVEPVPATLRLLAYPKERAEERPGLFARFSRPAIVMGASAAVAVVVFAGAKFKLMTSEPVVAPPISIWLSGSAKGALSAASAEPAPIPQRVGGSGEPQPGPAIARTATLRLMTTDFDSARPAVERAIAQARGLVSRMNVTGASPTPRTLVATLMIPADGLDGVLANLRSLGRVVDESRAGEDVTEQVVDLEARLANARNTEKRLVDLLQKRTGDLSDVLAAEREIARVREEIERFVARRNSLTQRVTYATVTLNVSEEPKASLNLGPPALTSRLRNALVIGVSAAFESFVGFLLILAQAGPTLLLWTLILAWPILALVRWQRGRGGRSVSSSIVR